MLSTLFYLLSILNDCIDYACELVDKATAICKLPFDDFAAIGTLCF